MAKKSNPAPAKQAREAEEEEEDEDDVEAEVTTQGAAAQIGGGGAAPSMLQALEGRFNELAGTKSGYLASLPLSIRKRLDALKNLSKENRKIDRDLQREINELEKKYFVQQVPIYEKRHQIVTGAYEPSEEECTRTQEEVEEEDALPDAPSEGLDINGIPEFWLTCLKNLPPLTETITEEDERALKHLIDIRYAFLEDNPGFTLEFEFEENEYFTNKVLTKSYYLIDSDAAQDLIYDHAEGCEIKWKEGKNLSVRIEVKKQRHKATNKTRTVKKTVPAETFFNFFVALEVPENEEEADDELMNMLEEDYETGEIIKEKLIPDAVNWFTGVALEEFQDQYGDDDEDDEEGYYDGMDDDEDDEDDDDEEGPAGEPAQAADCKQQ